jgi:uncharacterized protein YabE (DUF348 family)/3D (Asp-Asp-Asp) domain-containing protein
MKETHAKRSSTMSFALRWKHENLRLICTAALFSFALTSMFLVLLYGTAAKTVTLVINGQEKLVQTKQWTLQGLLDEQAVSIGEHDQLSVSAGRKLINGDYIAIEHAKQIRLTADGRTRTVYTTAKTVAEAIEGTDIQIGRRDKVIPPLGQPLPEDGAIRVVRVKRVVEENNQIIPYKTVTQKDPKLLKGKEKTIQEGSTGIVARKFEKVYEDGVIIATNEMDQWVRSPSRNKIVAIGTKSPVVILSASSPNVEQVTKTGMTFGVKRILKNVSLTAYAAGVKSTGKTEDHPQYGITYTGTRVEEGRTVAVDPKVIPLGWWIYIEGIGFRRAEDIGSAVKGKHVDIYFDDESYANRFGRKHGYTVYIVGPKKPTVN